MKKCKQKDVVRWLPWTTFINEQHNKQKLKQKIQEIIIGTTLLCVILGIVIIFI